MGKEQLEKQISRRDFIKVAGLGAAGVVVLGGTTQILAGCTSTPANIPSKWDYTTDVAVIGTGAAASAAAVTAREAGASVIMFEKSVAIGGTSSKSGGVYWIPNNFGLRDKGIQDKREDCVRFMARAAYSFLYKVDDPRFGLPQLEYDLLNAFYDNGFQAVDFFARIGALQSLQYDIIDYADHLTENKVPRGRTVAPKKTDGTRGAGAELIGQLSNWINSHDIDVLTSHRAQQIFLNTQNQVIGLELLKTDNGAQTVVNVRTNKAIIFGSGGFTHNPDLRLQYQLGPEYGGCAVITNEGDFVYMAQAVGAKLGNMTGAWNAQIPLEPALDSPSTPNDIWQPAGDSMILVNKYGIRVVNEKRSYNDRTKAHFYWDPVAQEYPNQLMIMIYDQRNRDLYQRSAGAYPIPPPGTTAPYELSGQTWKELEEKLRERVDRIGGRIGSWRLDDSFGNNLVATIEKFNEFANNGEDEVFHRGKYLYDTEWHSNVFSVPAQDTPWQINDKPNVTMYPFQPEGPYYAILLAAGTLDTNGGPQTNELAQVLDTRGKPIEGLYGAGNCICSPTRYYLAAGGTLGPALTFGYIAGINAVKEPVKQT
jgi:3-oxosteroid 1-dehydrogenase